MNYNETDPLGAFNNAVLSMSTPVFDGETLVGVYGVFYDADTFFVNLINPMLSVDDGIFYWVLSASDPSQVIYSNDADWQGHTFSQAQLD